MSRATARMILAVALILATPSIFLTTIFAIAAYTSPLYVLKSDLPMLACVITAAAFSGGWIALWHGQVRWTPMRTQRTLLSLPGLAVLGALLAVPATTDEGKGVGWIVGTLIWLPLWIAATALIWRAAPGEAAVVLAEAGRLQVLCPKCGYDLRGLHEARCPECGTQYTLDALLAQQLAVRQRDVEGPGN